MKLTFDKFVSWTFFAFFSGFGIIFYNIWQSVDTLNTNMAVIINDIGYQKLEIQKHDSRILFLEQQKGFKNGKSL